MYYNEKLVKAIKELLDAYIRMQRDQLLTEYGPIGNYDPDQDPEVQKVKKLLKETGEQTC